MYTHRALSTMDLTDICGFPQTSNLYNRSGHACWLGNVIVSPGHRGRGAGEFLLHAMMHKAKENYGVRELYLSCHHANSRGLAFYHKHSFRPFELKIPN